MLRKQKFKKKYSKNISKIRILDWGQFDPSDTKCAFFAGRQRVNFNTSASDFSLKRKLPIAAVNFCICKNFKRLSKFVLNFFLFVCSLAKA